MATVHPHKGYLNTEFRFYANGTENIPYCIHHPAGAKIIVSYGVLTPNEPHSFKPKEPGRYEVMFEDGSKSDIIVEDGYKFGGSRQKAAYIFNNTPWCIVVMNDRTYFYNKETEESYVEAISPDCIEEVSCDYILLRNNIHSYITLYSLNEQKPILCFSNLIFKTEDTIVWQDEECLVIYSLLANKIVHRIETSVYSFDKVKNRLIFGSSNNVLGCELSGEYGISEVLSQRGELITFIDNELAIYCSRKSNGSIINLCKLNDTLYDKGIYFKGHVAGINGVDIIDIESRRKAMYQFDIENSEFPEVSLEAEYPELRFYPCSWDIFYVQRDTKLTKTASSFHREEYIQLKSVESEVEQTLNRFENNTLITENRFILYNDTESFVRSHHYRAAGYLMGGKILVHNKIIIRVSDECVYILSGNGYWDHRKECDYDFSNFETYGIVRDNKTGIYRSFYYNIKGKEYNINSNPVNHIELGDSIILEGGKVYFKKVDFKKFSIKPIAVSPNLTQGIIIEENKIYLLDISSEEESRKQILSDIYDASEYHNVLLGEDGTHILYRDSDITRITNIISGKSCDFGNLSYVQQVNGIRPHFQLSGALQPRIVNPVTGQLLDCENMKQYNFISPDGTLYADTRLKEYVEYYWKMDKKSISHEEYSSLLKKYAYPWQEKHGSLAWKEVLNSRKEFIQEHFDYLNEIFPRLLHNDPTGKIWEKSVLDKDNKLGTQHFLERIIGKKGIAYIRRFSDDSVLAKIDLGEPLTYINYVSFSYDSRYMALAGYRGDRNSSWGGLFLIYDLIEKFVVTYQNTMRAVWVTAFSKSNALASYTSNPFTFFAKNEDEYDCDYFRSKLIEDRSFLTFSPNGRYFALSEQGYISKYNRYGATNQGWGHESSSLVEIRSVENSDKQIIQFHDLSDAGIADCTDKNSKCPKSVASVSFSNNNRRLMMVGKDGVVIIRNLHLEDNAGE